jgi:hypothetical protein
VSPQEEEVQAQPVQGPQLQTEVELLTAFRETANQAQELIEVAKNEPSFSKVQEHVATITSIIGHLQEQAVQLKEKSAELGVNAQIKISEIQTILAALVQSNYNNAENAYKKISAEIEELSQLAQSSYKAAENSLAQAQAAVAADKAKMFAEFAGIEAGQAAEFAARAQELAKKGRSGDTVEVTAARQAAQMAAIRATSAAAIAQQKLTVSRVKEQNTGIMGFVAATTGVLAVAFGPQLLEQGKNLLGGLIQKIRA